MRRVPNRFRQKCAVTFWNLTEKVTINTMAVHRLYIVQCYLFTEIQILVDRERCLRNVNPTVFFTSKVPEK